jgi:4'-phosphopantetheinyl transferase EntD
LKEYIILELLSTILPQGARAVEGFGALHASDLFPEESRLLGNVSEKRRAEFSLGRSCAHQALAKLGIERQPILRGACREPIWPKGVVGSITHCEGYCAAALGWSSEIAGLGIDAEFRRPLKADVLKLVATDRELRWNSGADPSIPWDLLLFSAKESVFKAWFPLVGTWLGFEEAEIDFDEDGNLFRATLAPVRSARRDLQRMWGRYRVTDTHVFTCAFVEV